MITGVIRISSQTALKLVLPFLLMLGLVLTYNPVKAQTYSYDGQRWYEAEVSIFTNEPVPELFPEVRDMTDLTLQYPSRTTTLRTMTQSLELPEELYNPLIPGFEEAEEIPDYGPDYTPGTDRSVIQDVEREAFIRLGNDTSTFIRHNSRIRNAADHRLLFHAVWRFPVRDQSSTTSVAVSGGGFYSPHFELEGYLGFSLNGNRIDLNADLWLMDLIPATGRARDTDIVQVPVSPLAQDTDEDGQIVNPQRAFLVQDLWRLKEVRPMISRQLHYLDHPRLGIIAEVRPYQLPPRSSEP